MRLRKLLLFLLCLLPLTPAAHALVTPTEARALAAAAQDHTAYTLPPAALAKAETLATTRHIVYFGGILWSVVSLWLLLHFRIAARMRNVANNISKNRWAQGFTFFLQFLIVTTILGLPLEIYNQHIQRAYGLSVQHWGSWLGDQAKSFALVLIFGFLGVMLLFRLVRKFPRKWWLLLSFAMMVFTLIGVLITPYVIDPLFNKFEPLTKSNPALVQQLEQVVARGKGVEIPPERMFLMKASDKVTTLNAYVTGFGASKRVVVWDTSIAKGTPDEILFIFGHEMGHYVLGHIVTGVLFSFVLILVSFYLGYHALQYLLRRFGPQWRIPTQDNWAALVVFVLVLNVFSFFISPIASSFSRAHEHAADVYGMEAVHGIVADPQASGQQAFQLLGENSYSVPDPNPLVEFWTGSHPPIWLRAAFARHYDPWAAGEQPKYFNK